MLQKHLNLTTRLGSKVRVDVIDEKYVYGAWFDNVSMWYPCKWSNKDGKYIEDGDPVSLDLVGWIPSPLS